MRQQAIVVTGALHRYNLLPDACLVVGEVGDNTDKLRFAVQLHVRQRFERIGQQGKILMVV
ncbi:Uncharacterised protein [Salmonella enterica subsp. enterica serovar Sanjuan]|uniref:Uncharacterized protein n=1 Tax=Salmonella enterica subsp. enterica serovar Sanjuan TaxID=1160765 RepID=A0A3S4EMX2_SALET|nr:Uncharacterised protein [Salmonella enterica subsp. enterica serovar Sanjuan]